MIATTIKPHLTPLSPEDFPSYKGVSSLYSCFITAHTLCVTDLTQLVNDAWKEGVLLVIQNWFRDLPLQGILWKQNGGEAGYVAIPGSSQHHLGLCGDFTSPEIDYKVRSDAGFESSKSGVWLNRYGHDYGFVQPYINKHDNNPSSEPWHWLYVGKKLAQFHHELKQAQWPGDIFDLQNLYPQSIL